MKGREIMKKRYGFTLAEVLITLGIIGVVASMTIPTLMNQTSGAEFKSGFKKLVSTLNQAVTMNVALNSEDFSNLSGTDMTHTQSTFYMLSQRMNVIESSNAGDAFGSMAGTGNYTLFFNDGMAVSFPTGAASCAAAGATNCMMVVDVNGRKKPNQLSTATNETTKSNLKDQFVLDFYNQQVLPHDSKSKYALYN